MVKNKIFKFVSVRPSLLASKQQILKKSARYSDSEESNLHKIVAKLEGPNAHIDAFKVASD